MARESRYDVLFEPIRIGPKMMRNRFYQTPHASSLESQAPGAEAYFRGMKAEGGWAVVNTGHTQIAPEYDYSGFHVVSRIWDEDDVRNWSLTTDRIHEAGSLAGIELAATGAAISGHESRLPARAISNAADDRFWMGASYEMQKSDIKRLQKDYVAAAIRARSAGFDIVSIHGAMEWSVCTRFLMPHYNRRTDEYGGSLENRARFWLETLELVRQAVGDDCAIAARHCLDTPDSKGRIRFDEEGLGFVRLADPLVDYWDVQVGDSVRDQGASRFTVENYQGEWIKRVREQTAKPLVGVGRFTSPDTMVSVIRSGQQDIIGAARASIADPFLPVKVEEGRLDEIRECIGCNVCISRVNLPSRIICTQNATSGEEYRRGWHPEQFIRTSNPSRTALVVGAGPAGLECATVLARQGFEYVHLVESKRKVGGHLAWVSRLPGLAEWARVIDYRMTIANGLRNLAVVTNKHLSADDVLDYGADRVVVATGSRWAADGLNAITQGPISGADARLDHVLTPEEVMADDGVPIGDSVVVYDCEGYFMGVSLAEKTALEGKKVTLITPMEVPGPYLRWTEEHREMMKTLFGLEVKIVSGHTIDSITPEGLYGRSMEHAELTASWPADTTVLVTQRVPNTQLYRDLQDLSQPADEAGIQLIARIGDCVAPRPQVADAIFDGHRLAREIDDADPTEPRPWIREGRILSATAEHYDAVVKSGVPLAPHSEPSQGRSGMAAAADVEVEP